MRRSLCPSARPVAEVELRYLRPPTPKSATMFGGRVCPPSLMLRTNPTGLRIRTRAHRTDRPQGLPSPTGDPALRGVARPDSIPTRPDPSRADATPGNRGKPRLGTRPKRSPKRSRNALSLGLSLPRPWKHDLLQHSLHHHSLHHHHRRPRM